MSASASLIHRVAHRHARHLALGLIALAAAALAVTSPATAQPAPAEAPAIGSPGNASGEALAKFFKQNGLRLVVASGAGGGFDVYSRVLSRHYGRHLPGNPNIVIQNMPGASGITATSWAYTNAPRDGSRVLATYSTMIDQNLLGNANAQFDVRRFNWLGSIAKTQLLCLTWSGSPVTDIRQAIGKTITVSATGRAGNTATLPLMLNQLIGTDFKVISGYSTTGSYLALERGEVDGICGVGISTMRASNPDWFANKRVNMIVQVGLENHPDIPAVTNALDLVSGRNREVLEFNAIIQEMGRPYLAPPETPVDRLTALRTGFDQTMTDPAFLAEADKLGLDVSALDGSAMERLIAKLYGYSPETIQNVAATLGIAEKSEVERCDKFSRTSERCDASEKAP